eukprot:scaffold2572_cov75-Skeletonema_marinoi.AAC.22
MAILLASKHIRMNHLLLVNIYRETNRISPYASLPAILFKLRSSVSFCLAKETLALESTSTLMKSLETEDYSVLLLSCFTDGDNILPSYAYTKEVRRTAPNTAAELPVFVHSAAPTSSLQISWSWISHTHNLRNIQLARTTSCQVGRQERKTHTSSSTRNRL